MDVWATTVWIRSETEDCYLQRRAKTGDPKDVYQSRFQGSWDESLIQMCIDQDHDCQGVQYTRLMGYRYRKHMYIIIRFND
jgi:hypothetical protein